MNREDEAILRRRRRFAEWLRKARAAAQLTQEELSVRVDRSQSAITGWESAGLEIMTPEEMRALAVALDVKPVEVAAALGYPTLPPTVVTVPMSKQEWLHHLAELGRRLDEVREEWGDELFPPQAAEHGLNGRGG
jgi:transcriptional regulator with XRE-family HTH domain